MAKTHYIVRGATSLCGRIGGHDLKHTEHPTCKRCQNELSQMTQAEKDARRRGLKQCFSREA